MNISDYQAKPELDQYEADGIDDDGEHQQIDYRERMELERKMNQEERMRQLKGRRAGAFMDDEEYSDGDMDIARQMRMERMRQLR